jgi:hypothetical protein
VLDEIGRFRLRQAQRDKEVEEAKKQKVSVRSWVLTESVAFVPVSHPYPCMLLCSIGHDGLHTLACCRFGNASENSRSGNVEKPRPPPPRHLTPPPLPLPPEPERVLALALAARTVPWRVSTTLATSDTPPPPPPPLPPLLGPGPGPGPGRSADATSRCPPRPARRTRKPSDAAASRSVHPFPMTSAI